MFEKQFWPYDFMTRHSSAKGTRRRIFPDHRPGPACRPVSLSPTPAFTSQGQVALNLGGLEYPIQPSAAVGVGMLPPHSPTLSSHNTDCNIPPSGIPLFSPQLFIQYRLPCLILLEGIKPGSLSSVSLLQTEARLTGSHTQT